MKKLITYFVFALMALNSFSQEIEFRTVDKGLINWQPAPIWEDASLLGNGEMGAMVFGKPHDETIIINHCALYMPTTFPFKPIKMYPLLPEIKQLILEGKGSEATLIPVEESLKEGYPGQIWNDPYIPAFDLKIKVSAANIQKYQRLLNYETGESVITWIQEGVKFERRQFISRKDSLLVLNIRGSENFDATFELTQRPVNWDQWDFINENIKTTQISGEGKNLYYYSEFVKQWQPSIIAYEGIAQIKETDGTIETEGKSIKVKNAKNITFFLKVNPIYWAKTSKKEAILSDFEKLSSEYTNLLERHKVVHSELFNRVSLDLNAKTEDRNLFGEVMMQQAKDTNNAAFIEKQFYAARYNILSATGKNIPNLQGIWGSSWTPPWSSGRTHDGNLPVAISSFLSSNMPELMLSFFDYHDKLLPYYRENAKNLYNCRGLQVPGHTSSHGYNVHFDKTWCLLFWNGGAAWISHFYYDYWLYTKDLTFLEKRAYPFMKESALFFEDFLSLGKDGKYLFNPSYSPENNPANNPSQAVLNATMDVALVKELLRNLIASGEILHESENQLKKWKDMLAKMPNYANDEHGVFKEWLWSEYQENHHHRHISHLYPMFDVMDPEIAKSPELMEGVKKAVHERMKVRRNDNGGVMVFGLAQMAWVAENLGDAALTEDIINWLSSQYWSNSLATYHDPNGLFNMDLSGGFQTVIIKALMYSDENSINLLPAKPLSWKKGKITGIKARNQIEIQELSWTEKMISCSILSQKQQRLKIKFPAKAAKITLNGKEIKATKNELSIFIDLKINEVANVLIEF